MSEDRSEGLLVRAQPLEQAEHISRLIVDVRVADGVLLLDADPAWAEAINTVLATKGVRVSELYPIRSGKVEPPTPRYHSVQRGIEACERTATGLILASTHWTK
jgi:hypothetical protein